MTAYEEPNDALRTSAVVVALFVDQDTAERAIADLREAGLNEDAIVVAEPKDPKTAAVDYPAGLARGAAEGALSGGIVGGALGVLGSILLPGVGPTIAGGLLGVLLVSGCLGAVAGGLIGALVNLIPANGRAEPGEQPGTLVTVLAEDPAIHPRTILGLLWKRRERRNLPSFNYFGPDRRLAAL
jgi:hypothetical protein